MMQIEFTLQTRRRCRARLAAVVALAMTASVASAMPSNGLLAARVELTRVHARLTRAAATDPAVLDARAAAGRASADLYQTRANVLAKVYHSDAYADLRLALWSKQKQLEGLYVEVPMRVQAIANDAKDSLSIRAKMSEMEQAALDADANYAQVRDDANQKLAAYAAAQRDAMDAIRNDPDFLAASQRVLAMQRAITGYRAAQAVASAQ